VPLTAGTHHLLSEDAITRMKPTAALVNTARGAIVDEGALVAALRDRRLTAAGLDVFEVEPVAPDNPLLGLDNVVLTPHVTGYTADACGAI
jgi:phosphoglycerate dehydrogenase-like enzyme